MQKNVFLIIKKRAREYIKFNYKPNKTSIIFVVSNYKLNLCLYFITINLIYVFFP
jgi:hypothetical protein